MTPTDVSQWAIDNGVELHRPEKAIELTPLAQQVDCIITIGYGLLIPKSVIEIPRYGFLNLHFSLLPRWRGAAPVQRSIEAQDRVSGVTVFALDEGMDTGPIYTVHRFALDDDISSDELLDELALVGVDAVLETLITIESGVKPIPQQSDGATRALKLSKEEGHIDWSQPSEVVSAKIRAFTSNPGAWTHFRGNTLKISHPIQAAVSLSAGEISVVDKKVLIGTGTNALEIGFITAPGKQAMSAFAWANGARLEPGERCE
jgi:methionyl-tRNA formyltransferase